MIALAREHDRLLAVNHNGRWAPTSPQPCRRSGAATYQLRRLRRVFWPQDRQLEYDPHFSRMTDLVVFDFGVHWFDVVAQLFADAGPARR